MTDSEKNYHGKKNQCIVYLDNETFENIENSRGLVKRSTYLEDIIKSSIRKEVAC
ncbi:hypothetical protein ACSAZL_09695 [Methanosarcina sp. T3]|uniref:hypothetical protein n=1 Tax=Methanosarcina sp. T3 TaxID=3439062 RepID=UPI003F844FE6